MTTQRANTYCFFSHWILPSKIFKPLLCPDSLFYCHFSSHLPKLFQQRYFLSYFQALSLRREHSRVPRSWAAVHRDWSRARRGRGKLDPGLPELPEPGDAADQRPGDYSNFVGEQADRHEEPTWWRSVWLGVVVRLCLICIYLLRFSSKKMMILIS